MIVVRLSDKEFDYKDQTRCTELFAFTNTMLASKVWRPGSMDFTFTRESSATLFLMKFGGNVIDRDQLTVEYVGKFL